MVIELLPAFSWTVTSAVSYWSHLWDVAQPRGPRRQALLGEITCAINPQVDRIRIAGSPPPPLNLADASWYSGSLLRRLYTGDLGKQLEPVHHQRERPSTRDLHTLVRVLVPNELEVGAQPQPESRAHRPGHSAHL